VPLLLQLHVVAVAPRRRYNLGQLAEGQPSTPFLLHAPIPGVANGLHRSYKGTKGDGRCYKPVAVPQRSTTRFVCSHSPSYKLVAVLLMSSVRTASARCRSCKLLAVLQTTNIRVASTCRRCHGDASRTNNATTLIHVARCGLCRGWRKPVVAAALVLQAQAVVAAALVLQDSRCRAQLRWCKSAVGVAMVLQDGNSQ
jgi:predicted metal-binding protein